MGRRQSHEYIMGGNLGDSEMISDITQFNMFNLEINQGPEKVKCFSWMNSKFFLEARSPNSCFTTQPCITPIIGLANLCFAFYYCPFHFLIHHAYSLREVTLSILLTTVFPEPKIQSHPRPQDKDTSQALKEKSRELSSHLINSEIHM